jgi:hypothetical protein
MAQLHISTKNSENMQLRHKNNIVYKIKNLYLLERL